MPKPTVMDEHSIIAICPPLTFSIGFVDARLQDVVSKYRKWMRLTLRATRVRQTSGLLRELLKNLEPLDNEGRTAMFVRKIPLGRVLR